MVPSLKLAAAGILLLSLCATIRAWESSPPKTQGQVLKVDVDLVLVRVTVSDRRGRMVTGLGPELFQLWEDKIEQKIEYFSEEEMPLHVGVIFDVSGSMEGKISKARDAAHAFLAAGNSEDEYFLVEFNTEAKLTEDFTTNPSQLQQRFIFTQARGMTALFDAVYLGLETLKERGNRRKALLLITDGEDNHSRYTFSDVKEFVKEQDVQIFAIGAVNFGAWQINGPQIIEDLVGITGGKAFFPKSVDELEAICARIAAELKSEYVIGYRPTNGTKDGRWRKIHVKVNPPKGMPRLGVRARSGYYAPSETSR